MFTISFTADLCYAECRAVDSMIKHLRSLGYDVRSVFPCTDGSEYVVTPPPEVEQVEVQDDVVGRVAELERVVANHQKLLELLKNEVLYSDGASRFDYLWGMISKIQNKLGTLDRCWNKIAVHDERLDALEGDYGDD